MEDEYITGDSSHRLPLKSQREEKGARKTSRKGINKDKR